MITCAHPEPDLQRRDLIVTTLLDWYQDVIESWRDDTAAGDHGYPMMNRAWNHPSYRELERLRLIMRTTERRLHWHLAERYLRATHHRVMRCPRCDRTWPYTDTLGVHRHGHHVISLVPASVPIIPTTVDPLLVQAAIRWLSERFTREPFLPEIDGHLLGDSRQRRTDVSTAA